MHVVSDKFDVSFKNTLTTVWTQDHLTPFHVTHGVTTIISKRETQSSHDHHAGSPQPEAKLRSQDLPRNLSALPPVRRHWWSLSGWSCNAEHSPSRALLGCTSTWEGGRAWGQDAPSSRAAVLITHLGV